MEEGDLTCNLKKGENLMSARSVSSPYKRLTGAALCLGVLLAFGILFAGCADHDDDDDDSSTTSGVAGQTEQASTSSSSKSSTSNPPASTPSTSSSSKSSSYPSIQGSGILWKPVSESDGKLAVLIPSSMGAQKVSVLDSSGNLIENGRYVGRTNPNRPTYRFGRPGGSFPVPCLLRVGSRTYNVPNGRQRYQ